MLSQKYLSDSMIQAKPFLKWAGGKRQLLEQFNDFFPENYSVYYEPMVGGGAVFFHLAPHKAVLNDTNEDLIKAFKVVRDNAEKLIEILKIYEEKHNEDFYYETRDNFNEFKKKGKESQQIKLVAQLIYLNHTCFNGLYRVNQSGEFNVPIGSYRNPTISDEENLRKVSKILQDVELMCGDFENILPLVNSNDFVYFDPPYHPINKTSNFTEYAKNGFIEKDQVRLASFFEILDKKGVKLMLSNSNSKFIRELYKDFSIHVVKANRSINSKGDQRGKIKEIVVTNY